MNSVSELPVLACAGTRRVTFRTRGHTHGPITRLMSPGDLGELLGSFTGPDGPLPW